MLISQTSLLSPPAAFIFSFLQMRINLFSFFLLGHFMFLFVFVKKLLQNKKMPLLIGNLNFIDFTLSPVFCGKMSLFSVCTKRCYCDGCCSVVSCTILTYELKYLKHLALLRVETKKTKVAVN